jgi:small subunit ribosomal protein S19e
MSTAFQDEVTLKLVYHQKLIANLASRLKTEFTEIKPPAWSAFVKTKPAGLEPPKSKEWWYIRAASLMRKMALRGAMGVKDFRLEYGGKRMSKSRPERFRMASGGHIRRILRQLENAKLVQKSPHGGRSLTKRGRELVLSVAQDELSKSEHGQAHIRAYTSV